jgi:hypothetical protein
MTARNRCRSTPDEMGTRMDACVADTVVELLNRDPQPGEPASVTRLRAILRRVRASETKGRRTPMRRAS